MVLTIEVIRAPNFLLKFATEFISASFVKYW